MKELIKKHIKNVIIILIISIIIQLLLMVYNICIHKLYEYKHLINNTPIEIDIQNCNLSEPDEWGYVYLQYNGEISDVNNIELVMKQQMDDKYIRLICEDNDNVLMLKSDKEQKVYKTYMNKQINIKDFKICYHKDDLQLNDIDKLIVNDNLYYMPEVEFSTTNLIIIFSIIITFYIAVQFYYILQTKELKISKGKLFLIIGSVIGCVFCFTNLVLRTYDEHAHFWRAYEISAGKLTSNSNKALPKSIYDIVIDENGTYRIEKNSYKYSNVLSHIQDKLKPENSVKISAGTVSTLSPFSYFPQATGILIGRLLQLNPYIIAILGRITNLIFYLLLVFWAIQLMPKEKWKNILMVCALLPMSMEIAASLSPDAIIISTMYLAISYLLHLKYVKKKSGIKETIIFGILCLIPSMCKIVYIFIAILFFTIPKEKFEKQKQKILYFILIMCIILIPYFSWNIIPKQGEIAIRTNQTEQIYFTLSDPMRDLETGVNTLYNYIINGENENYVFTMIGGWFTPYIIDFVFLGILLFATFCKNKKNNNKSDIQLENKDKILILIISLLIILMIFAGLYTGYTRSCYTIVEGVQGRYFLPILPLLLILIEKDKIQYSIEKIRIKYLVLSILLYIPPVITMIEHFK